MRHSRRFHLVLGPELDQALRTFAATHGLSLAEGLRTLTRRSLADQTAGPPAIARESAGVLATLVAAEHAVLMVASVLPEGRRRMYEMAAEATAAAEARLGLFRDSTQ